MATDIIARGMITEYKSGTNISFKENDDGSVTISASGDVSSEDTIARETIDNHKLDKNNPHNVTAEQVGLGNVDNTADLDKPISTAVQTALDNKADKTVATTSADGLMSAEDKGKLDAFEITTTGGKLHDKDIATTDLIPTTLPANGGNADTVDNKHYTDFSQNAVLSTIEQVNDPNLESGIYSAENVSMSFSSDVASNWFMLIVNKHRASAGYGTQIAIPYDNGEQRGTFYRVCRAGNWGNWIRIADGGNADTVDNTHINTEDVKSSAVSKVNPIYDDEILKYNSETSSIERWKTNSFKVAYANTSNSAQKVVSGKVQLWEDNDGGNLRLTSPDGNHLMEMNFYNNQDFRIYFSNNGELTFPVNYNVGTKKFYINGNAGGVSCSLIGTASGCHYSTILDWANAQDGNANASIIAASGFPSDSPYQNEAMLTVQTDTINARKIVTWTQYLANQTPKIMQRCIFNGGWSDNNWRAVYG